MKVNRSRSIASKNMRAKGDTSDRPEELLAYNIIRHHLQGIVQYDKQLVVYFPSGGFCKLDVFFTYQNKKYAVRLMGPPHDPKKQQRKDYVQELNLIDLNYTVIDFWYQKMVYLFLRNRRKLDSVELELAYSEIKNELAKYKLTLGKLKKIDLQD